MTPLVHVDSASDSMRHEMRLKLGAHLLRLCQPECSLLHSEDEARALSASSPWFALDNVPANFTSDLRHGPAPGVDQDWFQQVDNQSPPGHWAASVLPTPCCVDTVMEPGRATRCAYHASRAGGCQHRWKGTRAQMTVAEHCPVACGRCLICPGHPQVEAFEKSRRQWTNGKT